MSGPSSWETAARACTLFFTAYMLYISVRSGMGSWKGADGSTLFGWHPFCMSLGFGIISVEAVRAIQRRRSASTNVQMHSSLNDCAIVLCMIGLYAIYSRKEDLGKPHFTSWHAWAGMMTLAGFLLNAAHGTLRTMRLLGGNVNKSSQTLQWIWVSQFHRIAGVLSHIVGTFALVLGLYSAWGIATLGTPIATVLSAMVAVGEIAILASVKFGGSMRDAGAMSHPSVTLKGDIEGRSLLQTADESGPQALELGSVDCT